MSAFNLRVYGLLIHEGAVLVADEIIKGAYITKFPGGGLEYGEGTRDCLRREFKEETGLDVVVGDHFYTTDYFQPSAFRSKDTDIFPLDQQIISVYYYVHCSDARALRVAKAVNEFSAEQINSGLDCEVFRWIPLSALRPEDVTLPIDKKVVELLKGISL